MNYSEAIHYLSTRLPTFQKVGKRAMNQGLDVMLRFSEYHQHPFTAYPTIHIAGTNGKGSTAHILAAILQAHCLNVGLFTSPHYRDFRERIKINGKYIDKKAITLYVQQHKTAMERIQPSYFEVSVAMAFDYFKQQKIDIAIIEAGLGGETDATNIIHPILSIITNVSLDHTDILGNSIAAIAKAKAGIIKKNTPILIGEYQNETAEIFKSKAQTTTSDIYFATQMLEPQLQSSNFQSSQFLVSSLNHSNDLKNKTHLCFNSQPIELGIFGNYQSKNLTTALAAIQILQQNQRFNFTTENILNGTKQIKQLTNMIGRWEVLGKKPTIVADSGHNEAGIALIVEQLSFIDFKNLHFVFGVVDDKNLSKILTLLPQNAHYYFCKPNIQRGVNVEVLKEKATKAGLKGQSFNTVINAFLAAKKIADTDDLIFVGGSSYVVGELMDEL